MTRGRDLSPARPPSFPLNGPSFIVRPDKENNHPAKAMMICVMGSTDRVDFWLLRRHTLFISDFLPSVSRKGILFFICAPFI